MARLLASFCDFGIPIIIGAVLYWSNRKPHQRGEPADASRRRSNLRLLAVGVVVFGLLRWAFSLATAPTPLQIAAENQLRAPSIEQLEGEVKNGVYRNEFFRLRLPLRPGWTESAHQEIVLQRKRMPAEGALGLSIIKQDAEDNTKNLAVQFTVERGSIGFSEVSGRQYLESMLKTLKEHPRPPRQAMFAPQSTFAGLKFDRLDMRRPMEIGDTGMTVFAAMSNGQAITFVCWYSTPELPEEILNLLNGMSRITSPTTTKQ